MWPDVCVKKKYLDICIYGLHYFINCLSMRKNCSCTPCSPLHCRVSLVYIKIMAIALSQVFDTPYTARWNRCASSWLGGVSEWQSPDQRVIHQPVAGATFASFLFGSFLVGETRPPMGHAFRDGNNFQTYQPAPLLNSQNIILKVSMSRDIQLLLSLAGKTQWEICKLIIYFK